MRVLATSVLLMLTIGRADQSTRSAVQGVEITPNGSQPSTRGAAENFTGAVRVDPMFAAREPARASAASVTFEPGARTAWHTHPAGQRLIVTAGLGWVQSWGGRMQEIRPGDVVWIPPGKKHWHGATPATGMSHIAIQEEVEGKVVEWLEKVGEEQYRSGAAGPPTGARQEGNMRIHLDVEGTPLTGTLDDSLTSRDFAALLPVTLTLTDYNRTEKISNLPERLTTKGAPAGSDPSAGDIAYYAPWGNLAVFYRDFGYSEGLIKLGTLDAGVEALERPGPLKVSIRSIEHEDGTP